MRCDPSLPAFADWSCAFHPRPAPAPPSRLSRVKSKVADLLSKTNAYEDKLSAYVADSLGVQSPDLRDDIALIVAASVGAVLCFCCSVSFSEATLPLCGGPALSRSGGVKRKKKNQKGIPMLSISTSFAFWRQIFSCFEADGRDKRFR